MGSLNWVWLTKQCWSLNYALIAGFSRLSEKKAAMKSSRFFLGTPKLLSLETTEQSPFWWDCKVWLRRLLALVVGTGWYIINLSFIYFFPDKRTLILLINSLEDYVIYVRIERSLLMFRLANLLHWVWC